MASSRVHPRLSGRARGLELLKQVYAELHWSLGDVYSPAELLRAAQSLIDVSNSEYSSKTYQDGVHYPGYYSYAVDTMIEQNPWAVFANEGRADNLDDDRFAANWNAVQRLLRLYNPDAYHPGVDADLSA
jgi:hypothetical protein